MIHLHNIFHPPQPSLEFAHDTGTIFRDRIRCAAK
jgi:hypothetical protein